MSERDWTEIERLRQQVLALENAGMETAAQLGEAEAGLDRFRQALEEIAHHAREGDYAGQVNAMRAIAWEALDG